MENNNLGKLIKLTRKRHKISQKELCYGLCSTSTLSRIEESECIENWQLLNALLDRLDLPSNIYDFIVSTEELIRYSIELKVNNMPTEDVLPLIDEYKNISVEESNLDKQFCLFAEVLATFRDTDYKKSWKHLQKALRFTIPDFNIDKELSITVFTTRELIILYYIANMEYFYMNRQQSAIKRLYHVLGKLKNKNSSPSKLKYIPSIINSLGGFEENYLRYNKEYELSDFGIDFCVKNGILRDFAFLLYTKAYAMCKMGFSSEYGKASKREAKKIFLQSFSVMLVQNKDMDTIMRGIAEAQELMEEDFVDLELLKQINCA